MQRSAVVAAQHMPDPKALRSPSIAAEARGSPVLIWNDRVSGTSRVRDRHAEGEFERLDASWHLSRTYV